MVLPLLAAPSLMGGSSLFSAFAGAGNIGSGAISAGNTLIGRDVAQKDIAGAQASQNLNMLLSAYDMILQQQRDQAAREATEAALLQIDENYGVGDTEQAMKNREILDQMREELGQSFAQPAAEQEREIAGQSSLGLRRRAAATGTGGSAQKSAERRESRRRGRSLVDIASGRQEAEEGFELGLEEGRSRQRSAVQFGSSDISLPFQQAGRSVGAQTAANVQGTRGLRPILDESGGVLINLARTAATGGA